MAPMRLPPWKKRKSLFRRPKKSARNNIRKQHNRLSDLKREINGIPVFSSNNNYRGCSDKCIKGVSGIYQAVSKSDSCAWVWGFILFYDPCSKNHTNRHYLCRLVRFGYRLVGYCRCAFIQGNPRHACDDWYGFDYFRRGGNSCFLKNGRSLNLTITCAVTVHCPLSGTAFRFT